MAWLLDTNVLSGLRRLQPEPRVDNRVRPMFDGRFIAATSIEHGLTLVTRDRRGFDRVRVPVVNPWGTG
jgi:predicted nucleic acid-binding protein